MENQFDYDAALSKVYKLLPYVESISGSYMKSICKSEMDCELLKKVLYEEEELLDWLDGKSL